jgi:tripartite-type tricarboxylate transporter receptor subunit TctC
MKTAIRLFGTAVLAIGAVLATAGANAAEDFYKGKRVTILVGFTPGGGYDAYARLMNRHYAKHIPGEPTIVVQNMPGAGSLTAVKYLTNGAPEDGTVMTIFNSGLFSQALSDPKEVDVDFSKFRFVGSATAEVRVCYATKASGVNSIQELLKQSEFVLGATGLGSSSYVNGALLRTMLGAKIKHVLGYPGSAEMRIAIERGELQGDCGSWGSIPQDWIKDGTAIPLVNFTRAKVQGMPDMPNIMDLVDSQEKKQILNLVLSASEIGRPFAMSPNVPPERLEILRKAFDAMVRDKEFLAEADKTGREVIGPMNGAGVEAMIKEINATPKDIIAKSGDAVK